MKHTEEVTRTLAAIPRPRLVAKLARTAFGLVFMAAAGFMAVKLAVPWYVYLPLGFFGAHIVSAELTQKGVAFVVAILKDLLSSVRGKNGSPPVA